jgi:glycosyltransferase involved in cell wall biosynthesis
VSRPRVAVYDAFWSTAGGGERYAAGVADVLSRTADVTLLSHEPVDTGWLGERLALDLSRVEVEVVDPCDPLDRVSSGYDLLVNLSYRSHGRNGAARGIYVVHFPDVPGGDRAPWQRALQDRLGPLLRTPREPRRVSGFHEPDLIRWQEVSWTNGRGVLEVDIAPGATQVVHLRFGRFVPGGETREIEVRLDGRRVAGATLRPPSSKAQVLEPLHLAFGVPGRSDSLELEIVSDSVVANDVLGNGDRRRLGVPLVGASVGWRPLDALRGRASLVSTPPPGLDWLDTYDVIVANSTFTQGWIDEWWGRPSEVLEPPVALRERGPKDPVILSVGRFFAPGRGHSKKQLEMVRAFARMVNEGLDGWELHLVGGCSADDAGYLDEVEAAAEGLPVVLHVDASGEEVDTLYTRASIYWHATGVGEDLANDPERAEHFGITTVEAMSAGAVPVVFRGGGQVDIVRDGVDGLTFVDLDQLVALTRELVEDEARRDRLAASARARAERYGLEAFGERLLALAHGRPS